MALNQDLRSEPHANCLTACGQVRASHLTSVALEEYTQIYRQ